MAGAAGNARPILRRLPPPCRLPLIAQLFSFLSVGVLATGLQYALTALLVLAAGLPLVPASTLGFLVSAAFNYWANARLTFAAQGSSAGNRAQQLRFGAMVALGCALNAGFLRLALALGLHPVLSQLLATAGVLASNFMLSRLWVFRKP
jgi:putative flippase GtrA